jgi:hypothetical protein
MEYRRQEVAQSAFIQFIDPWTTIILMLKNDVIVAALVENIPGQQDAQQQRHAEAGEGANDPFSEHGAKITPGNSLEGNESLSVRACTSCRWRGHTRRGALFREA